MHSVLNVFCWIVCRVGTSHNVLFVFSRLFVTVVSCALFGMSFLLVSYVSVSRTVLLTISHVGALCTVLCVLFYCLVG